MAGMERMSPWRCSSPYLPFVVFAMMVRVEVYLLTMPEAYGRGVAGAFCPGVSSPWWS